MKCDGEWKQTNNNVLSGVMTKVNNMPDEGVIRAFLMKLDPPIELGSKDFSF